LEHANNNTAADFESDYKERGANLLQQDFFIK